MSPVSNYVSSKERKGERGRRENFSQLTRGGRGAILNLNGKLARNLNVGKNNLLLFFNEAKVSSTF